jgi:putative DNA methylase
VFAVQPRLGVGLLTAATAYPKRLIEVDLPIARISAHSRREKSIRHGHIATLHMWWARRPLAACRAVVLAALLPDPADPECPEIFRTEVAGRLAALRELRGGAGRDWNNPIELRAALLDFVGDFANWDLSANRDYLETCRALVLVAHECLGGAPGTRPLVFDPFAGGGAIPLEALRVGAEAFASDLNPVAVLLNKVVLEYIPTYRQKLADEVQLWGDWIRTRTADELAQFYPSGSNGAVPIAYLWARTVKCEGPGCGAEVPMIRSLWLAKKGEGSVALRLLADRERRQVSTEIFEGAQAKDVGAGTVRRGSATCPVCGFTTKVDRVRVQMRERRGGAHDARMLAVRCNNPETGERQWRAPTDADLNAAKRAAEELARRKASHKGPLSLVPDEKISLNEIRRLSVPIYGMTTWGDIFTPRQALALSTLAGFVRTAPISTDDRGLDSAVRTSLGLAVDRMADFNASLCVLNSVGGRGVKGVFARQALPMVWDFMETNPLNSEAANWETCYRVTVEVCRAESHLLGGGTSRMADAATHPLPDDYANAVITDPPYYDAVPYAHLSDYFYVWLRRSIGELHPDLFSRPETAKEEEIVVDRPHELSTSKKGIEFYERALTKAFDEARRIVRPDGIGTVVFASKTTSSWEAILNAIVNSGWVITGSWPIDTEREARIAAQGQARLGSSIHIVCRPRENADGSLRIDVIGDWRNVLDELPKRIHEWMPRLTEEGVVGADAIFACLGPALEIFSRYSRVERANGETVALREYLEHVWATVSNEALSVIFKDADAARLEPDGRLTAMWLWTVGAAKMGPNGGATEGDSADESDAADEDESSDPGKKPKLTGFAMEYDAARKISQGLGVDLDKLESLVEITGETARLLPVPERTRYLFGRETQTEQQKTPRGRTKVKQGSLFEELEAAELTQSGTSTGLAGESAGARPGLTVLDRIHQAMILFAAGRGEAMKRFLVDGGAGADPRFWKLAQSLSALYPTGTDEKRWVDGVLARKRGLGFQA